MLTLEEFEEKHTKSGELYSPMWSEPLTITNPEILCKWYSNCKVLSTRGYIDVNNVHLLNITTEVVNHFTRLGYKITYSCYVNSPDINKDELTCEFDEGQFLYNPYSSDNITDKNIVFNIMDGSKLILDNFIKSDDIIANDQITVNILTFYPKTSAKSAIY